MVKPRVVEGEGEGIQDEITVEAYDRMQRRLRDKGWMETEQLLKAGIREGRALEIGPGPGYLGLEWLRKTQGTTLMGLEISQNMIEIAQRNAAEYGLQDRVSYILGDAGDIPFEDNAFDAVFSNGSLHEWSDPAAILNEINRVLKPQGIFLLSDLRRDMSLVVKWLMWAATRPKEIRPGLVTSINASYTRTELEELLNGTKLGRCEVMDVLPGLIARGCKGADSA